MAVWETPAYMNNSLEHMPIPEYGNHLPTENISLFLVWETCTLYLGNNSLYGNACLHCRTMQGNTCLFHVWKTPAISYSGRYPNYM